MEPTNGTGNVIHRSLPSRLELLGIVDKLVEGLTEQMQFEDVDRDAIAISVIEAGTNAIQHGHALEAGQLVDMIFEIQENGLVVTVHDEGPGFEPVQENEPSPPDLLSTRGRGIFIMRSMMDEVTFDFSKGTTVRLVKYRSEQEGGREPAE